MTLNNKSREIIIKETTKLIQKYGYAATSIQDIIKKSKAPKGSLYYYFPKGKDDIVMSSLDNIHLEFTKKFKSAIVDCGSLSCVLTSLLDLFKNKEKSYGTPSFRLTLLALETIGQAPAIYKKCGDMLLDWKSQIADEVEKFGYDRELSEKISEWFFSTLQGAICTSVIHGNKEKMQLAEKSIKMLAKLDKESLKEIFS